MRVIRTIEMDGRSIQIKELTVGEIRQWLATIADEREADITGNLLFDDLTLDDIALLTDMRKEEMDALHQVDLQKIVAALKAANPLFFHMRNRIVQAAKALPQETSLNALSQTPAS